MNFLEIVTDNLSGKERRKRRAKRKKAKREHKKMMKKLTPSQRKQVRKKERKEGKRGVRKLGTTLKKSAGAVLLTPLLPFKPIMVKILKQRGYNTNTMTFSQIVNKFYNDVVSKKNNKKSNFEPIDEDFITNHEAMKISYDEYSKEDHVIGASLGVVVDAVVDYFKEKKKKKDKNVSEGKNPNEGMTKEEEIIADGATKVVENLSKKASDEQPVTQSQQKNIKKIIIFGGGAIVLAIVLFGFFKKK